MKAFHNDPAVKEKYLTRLKAHAAADEFVKGTYWQNGKGCAVGCTIHGYDHQAYELELGLPVWLAHLEDALFERMSNEKAKQFPIRFLSAIRVGANVEPVKWKFASSVLTENIHRVEMLELEHDVKARVVGVLHKVKALNEQAVKRGAWDYSKELLDAVSIEANNASRAAWNACCDVGQRSVYHCAAWSAESAKSALWNTVSVAWSAASAEVAARLASRSGLASNAVDDSHSLSAAAYDRYAEILINLLQRAE